MITYTLHARAEARSDKDIALVHNRLFQHLKDHSPLCAEGTMPKTPRIKGGNLAAYVNLGGFLPEVMSGDAVYMFRRRADVSPSSGQDSININFKADTTLHKKVIFDLVPNLIGAMRPFILMMGDERFEDPLVQADGSI